MQLEKEKKMNDFIRSFTRAWGKGLGYSAARKTSWLIVPLILIAVAVMVFQALGYDFDWKEITHVLR
jgi:lipoprotein signal peptidase